MTATKLFLSAEAHLALRIGAGHLDPQRTLADTRT